MQSFQPSRGHLINVRSYCYEADEATKYSQLSAERVGFCFVDSGEPLKNLEHRVRWFAVGKMNTEKCIDEGRQVRLHPNKR